MSTGATVIPMTDMLSVAAGPSVELDPLRASFAGTVLTASDGAPYDEARTVYNAMFDRRPDVIARATCDADVVAAIRFARQHRLPIAVKAGGHSVAGYSAIEGGVLIDLGPMKRIEVDPIGHRVRVEPGVTWGELDAATQEHGLATTGGRMTTTGVAGFVLGSGSGWLERKHGLACDNLLSARVVTADGRVLTASETEHPELFWGLRGGGENFGIVTEFELRLHPVGPVIYGGMLIYPREQAGQIGRNFRDFMEHADRDVTGGIILMSAPPAPFVPADLQGQPAITVFCAYFGDPGRGEEALAPLRRVAPAVDLVGPLPYRQLQALTDPGNPPGRRLYWHSELLTDLPDAAIDTLVARADVATSSASVVIVAPYGGAVAGGRGRGADRRTVGAVVLPLLRDLDGCGRRPPRRLGARHARRGPALDEGRHGAQLPQPGRRSAGPQHVRGAQVRPARRAQGPVRPRHPDEPERATVPLTDR